VVLQFIPNALAGLTVSFPAISLGAAFGILARPPIKGQGGGGALKGIFSAGIIALITGAAGGTKVQCSGVTAPMATVFSQISLFAQKGGCRTDDDLRLYVPCTGDTPEVNCEGECAALDGVEWDPNGLRAQLAVSDLIDPDAYLNTVLLVTGVIISLCGILRTGKFISVVPNLVVSGFMCGIASLIWLREVGTLLGFAPARTSWDLLVGFEGAPQQDGFLIWNALVTFLTFAGTLLLPMLCRKVLPPHVARKVPSVLVVLVIVTLLAWPMNAANTDSARVELTDLGGDCEADGGVCFPAAEGGLCGGEACDTLTEEDCLLDDDGDWSDTCARGSAAIPCGNIVLQDECITTGGGKWFDNTIGSFADFAEILKRNQPWADWGSNPGMFGKMILDVLRLVLLAYLDTILTTLVVDKLLLQKGMWDIPTNKDRELGAQGVANSLCAFVGGVPGAQSTTVSVLAINEGGTNRIAGTMVRLHTCTCSASCMRA
jgi:MFS superfamily sulfate permease-like transporter